MTFWHLFKCKRHTAPSHFYISSRAKLRISFRMFKKFVITQKELAATYKKESQPIVRTNQEIASRRRGLQQQKLGLLFKVNLILYPDHLILLPPRPLGPLPYFPWLLSESPRDLGETCSRCCAAVCVFVRRFVRPGNCVLEVKHRGGGGRGGGVYPASAAAAPPGQLARPQSCSQSSTVRKISRTLHTTTRHQSPPPCVCDSVWCLLAIPLS